MAAPHRGPGRPAARGRPEPVQRWRHLSHGGRLHRRPRLVRRPHRRPNDAKTQKTAMGTTRFLQWDRVDDVAAAADAARADGYQVVGVELAEGAKALHELDLSTDVCLAVGHEDRGLSKAALAACDALAYVPMLGRVGSLNVATATAIALYEVRRRAWTG
ncbi:MAG: TrmH family RNA methyltransferase [Acidimicrobiales bacterium]